MGALPGMTGLLGFSRATSLTFISSATSDAATITIPSDAQAGDLVVLYQISGANGSIPASGSPANFQVLATGTWDAGGSIFIRAELNARVIGAGEAGTSITGMNNDFVNVKGIAVFRPNGRISSVVAFSPNFQGTAGDPSAQTVDVTGQSGLVLLLGQTRGSAAHSPTGTLATAGTVFNGGNNQRCAYLIQTTPTSKTWDMADTGTSNSLQSVGIAIT